MNIPAYLLNYIKNINKGGVTPTGEISITENGTYDVTDYASANVNISGYKLNSTAKLFYNLHGADKRFIQYKDILKYMVNVNENITCESMFAGNGVSHAEKIIDLSEFDTKNVTDFSSMFYNSTYKSVILTNLNTSNAETLSYMFGNSTFTDITTLDLSSFNTSKVTRMDAMFSSCLYLTSLILSNFNTSEVANMSYMFNTCRNITSLNLSNFVTTKVSNFSHMFYDCRNLVSLNISNFNFCHISSTGLDQFITSCSSLDLDSLKGILACLTTVPSGNSHKTLKYIGFTSAQCDSIATTDEWTALVALGWTTGY